MGRVSQGTEKAAKELQATIRSHLIDELGELRAKVDPQLALLGPSIRRIDAIEKEIRSWFDNAAADQSHLLAGPRYTVILGPKRHERKLNDKSKLRRILTKLKLFETLWSVTLEAIDKHTTAAERKTFLSEGFTGTRSIEVVLTPVHETQQPVHENVLPEAA